MWLLDKDDNPRGDATTAIQLGRKVGQERFAHVVWRSETRGPMFSKFYFRRVTVANDDGTPAVDRDPLWLVIEWPVDEKEPAKFTLTTLPRRMSKN